MSRKDTIIIAVLINAGLLIVLFASALKSSGPSHEMAAAIPPRSTYEPVNKKEVLHNGGDEVDQALQKFAATSAPQEKLPEYTSPAAPSFSFADDLKGFSAPQIATTAVFSPASASAEDKKPTEYTEIKVKKGDVLEKIARQHHTSVDAIIACNQLSSTNLRIGQTLKIPTKKAAAPAVQNVSSSSPAESFDGHKYYTVKTGDNPWTIAVKNHMKVEELLKLNHLDQEKARKLKPGDKLLIQ
jgi:peptidoglycan DL-endopeptidase LytF